MTEHYLCHFSFLRWTEVYWNLSDEGRRQVSSDLLAGLEAQLECFSVYQVFPARADTDLLVWSSFQINDTGQPAEAMQKLARLLAPARRYLQPQHLWWGFTKPSDYARGKSSQEIDPMAGSHKRYLVVYPFTKTSEWYRFSRDARQGMMNEHIRVGHQYPQITQLLLYSTGLQDQEFIVIYETDDLAQFSTLVSELRSSEARRFTERDTPIYTAVYHPAPETLDLFV